MTQPRTTVREGLLMLADGTTFEGELIGATPSNGVATGEVVFNTVLSGYQEVITDPSYAGQIITFTYPHIGNYGANQTDNEAARPHARGVIVRDLARRRSNWRSEEDLDHFLVRHNVPGIAGVDTRRLTRHIRDAGATPAAFGSADETTLKQAALDEPGTDRADLVRDVTTAEPYTVGNGPRRVVAYDFGIKTAILNHLGEIATVEVVPASTPAADVLARGPDGVFLSNGPGDPAALAYITEAIRDLLGEVAVFGICLGHQLLSTAVGGTTFKLPFGHHGGNHPVRNLATNAVEITSQTHNYAVADDSLAGVAVVTHRNLNDGVVEGIRVLDAPAHSVQYHPEAGPGPHDARYLFAQFDALMQQTESRP
jgi:carbamoyl-phosphate synthase small subunit